MNLKEAKHILNENGYELLDEGKLGRAIGMGALKLQDWKSVELANMGTKEFKEVAIAAGLAAAAAALALVTIFVYTGLTQGLVAMRYFVLHMFLLALSHGSFLGLRWFVCRRCRLAYAYSFSFYIDFLFAQLLERFRF